MRKQTKKNAETSEKLLNQYITTTGVSSATIIAYKKAVALFGNSTGCKCYTAATKADVVDFVQFLTAKYGGTSGTAAYYFGILKTLALFAVEMNIVENTPFAAVKPRFKKATPAVGSGREKALNAAEVQKLIDTPCADEEVRDAFLFSCLTGLRLVDVERLTPGNFEEIGGVTYYFGNAQKTGIRQEIPLNDRALSIIAKRLEKPLIFTLKNRMHTLRCLKEWATAAGISKNVSYHTARHTFCTLIYNKTGDIYITQRLAGHARIETTINYYAEVAHSQLERAINSLSL